MTGLGREASCPNPLLTGHRREFLEGPLRVGKCLVSPPGPYRPVDLAILFVSRQATENDKRSWNASRR